MNAKRCKAIRRFIGERWRHALYHIPPLIPVFVPVMGINGKPSGELTIQHYKTDTVTLQGYGRAYYQHVKKVMGVGIPTQNMRRLAA